MDPVLAAGYIGASLWGTLIGGAFRLAPRLIDLLDAHLERKQEIERMQIQLEAERIRGPGRLDKALDVETGQFLSQVEALKEAWTQQFQTGNARLDMVSILVRPGVTYATVGLYILVKAVMLGAAVFGNTPFTQAYTENDMAFLSGITTFWFLGRPMEKKA